MKVAIAQINCVVGDIAGNAERILMAALHAHQGGATLMITPELALSGYPPEDLLFREDFYHACEAALRRIAVASPEMTLLVGYPAYRNGQCFNAASVLQNGTIVATYHKQELPNYSVFDEVRYFEPGREAVVFEHDGVRIGVLICADIWESGPAAIAKAAGAEMLLVLNASPYHQEKLQERYQVVRARIAETGLPVVYANLVGGQDELVFDGGSFVLDAEGHLMRQLPLFEESLGMVEFNRASPLLGDIVAEPGLEAAIYSALCLGVRDYVNKNNFPGVVLGLSGGIDSALTLAIAVDALGADRVQAVMMPSRYTAQISLDDAAQMAAALDVNYRIMPIEPLFEGFVDTLAESFTGLPQDLTEENLQARIRGTLLMALSNKYGSIVLTTGNKSEMSVGYSTLYGDMAGGFCVLKDVPKTMVYRLSHYRNSLAAVIPERIITRAPSAELRQDQCDQDSLPPYETLDAIMQAYVEDDMSAEDIISMGFAREDVARVVTLIDRNEYKRRQAPVGVRITQRGFGKDWRYPITSKYRYKI